LGVVALGAATLSACGSPGQAAPVAGSASDAVAAGAAAVMINGFVFGPTALTVKAGATVTWTNQDEEPHTVVGPDLKSPVLGNPGSTFSHTFTTAGTYSYNCSIHPYMHGTVTVTP
jgi:plastocyanin